VLDDDAALTLIFGQVNDLGYLFPYLGDAQLAIHALPSDGV
jgi:hypothetical protein